MHSSPLVFRRAGDGFVLHMRGRKTDYRVKQFQRKKWIVEVYSAGGWTRLPRSYGSRGEAQAGAVSAFRARIRP